jgi:long-subunit fatty acid transport protein
MLLRAIISYLLFACLAFGAGARLARAQEGALMNGASSAALGNTMLTDTNAWAAINNPSGMAMATRASISAGYRNAFMIENLGVKSLVAVLPFGNSAFGASVQSFGYQKYLSNRIGLAYGLRLGEKTAIGAQINYYSLTLEEYYGRTQFWTLGLGARFIASKKLTLGASVANFNEAKISAYQNERAPARIAVGMSYTWSSKLRMTAEAQQVSGQKGGVRIGLEYRPVSNFVLRGGGGSGPTLYSFGFGWRIKYFDIDVASHYHQVLGFSPQVALTWAGLIK